MSVIAKNDALLAELEQLGLEAKKASEPEAGSLAVRYRYDPETGQIFGPKGKALKAALNRGTWRVGVWHEGTSVRVMVGRLAFALQYGRWPVGVRYVNGDTSDHRAENLRECESLAMKAARRDGGSASTDLVALPSSSFGEGPDFSDPRSYRAAVWRGRDLRDELDMIERVLGSSVGLHPVQRLKLESVHARMLRQWSRAVAAAAYVSAKLAYSGSGPAPVERQVPDVPLAVTRGPAGPSAAQKKAAGVRPSRKPKAGPSAAQMKAAGVRPSRKAKSGSWARPKKAGAARRSR